MLRNLATRRAQNPAAWLDLRDSPFYVLPDQMPRGDLPRAVLARCLARPKPCYSAAFSAAFSAASIASAFFSTSSTMWSIILSLLILWLCLPAR